MLTFVGDIDLLADEKTELEEALNCMHDIWHRNFNRMVNIKKMKVMVCSNDCQEQLSDTEKFISLRNSVI